MSCHITWSPDGHGKRFGQYYVHSVWIIIELFYDSEFQISELIFNNLISSITNSSRASEAQIVSWPSKWNISCSVFSCECLSWLESLMKGVQTSDSCFELRRTSLFTWIFRIFAGTMDPDRKTWELTPYEQHRTPHTLETGGEAVLSTPRFLEAELSCAICLDILRDTRTTKECLHRFCGECISQALRSGNKVSSSFYSGETFNHFNAVIW